MAKGEINSYLTYYGKLNDRVLKKIIDSVIDLAILHPHWEDYGNNVSKEFVARLHQNNIKVAGYISFGEDTTKRNLDKVTFYLEDTKGNHLRNHIWKGHYVNPNKDWYKNEICPKIMDLCKKGFDYVFMDTLDTSFLSIISDQQRKQIAENFLWLVKQARSDYPKIKYIANRGFNLLLDYPYEKSILRYIHGVMFESFPTVSESKDGFKWLKGILDAIKERVDGMGVEDDFLYLGLNYAKENSKQHMRYYDHFRSLGILPDVENKKLDTIYKRF